MEQMGTEVPRGGQDGASAKPRGTTVWTTAQPPGCVRPETAQSGGPVPGRHWLWAWTAWLRFLSPLLSCVTSAGALNLSGLQFPRLEGVCTHTFV